MKILKILTVLLIFNSTLHAAETFIPRSVQGDKGKYYLISQTKNGNIITAISKRVGVYDTYFTKTETNCNTMQMREMGDSDFAIDKIKLKPTKWFDLVEGSSKSDLAHFLCKK